MCVCVCGSARGRLASSSLAFTSAPRAIKKATSAQFPMIVALRSSVQASCTVGVWDRA